MKQTVLVAMALSLAGSYAMARDLRYSCEPSNHDGDAYGSLLTLRIGDDSLRLTGEYLKSIHTAKLDHATRDAKWIVYRGLGLDGDEKSTASLDPDLFAGKESGTLQLDSRIEDGDQFLCKRAEQTIEWADKDTDSGRVVVTTYDIRTKTDEPVLGYAKDLADRKACYRGDAAHVQSELLEKGLKVGAETRPASLFLKEKSAIVFQGCRMDGETYDVEIPLCPASAL